MDRWHAIRESRHFAPPCSAWGRWLLTGIAVFGLWTAPAVAQVVAQGQTLGRMDVVLTGTIASSVTLTVEGSINQRVAASTIVHGGGPQGTVDFGNFRGGLPATGEVYQVDGNAKGTYLVATLRLRTRFTGAGGSRAVLDIQRAIPCGDSPGLPCGGAGSLFYAKMAQRVANQAVAWPTWDAYPDHKLGVSVFAVPDVTYVPGAGNLDQLMENGDSIDHQVAVWVPDDAPEGTFSAVVTYTVTRL